MSFPNSQKAELESFLVRFLQAVSPYQGMHPEECRDLVPLAEKALAAVQSGPEGDADLLKEDRETLITRVLNLRAKCDRLERELAEQTAIARRETLAAQHYSKQSAGAEREAALREAASLCILTPVRCEDPHDQEVRDRTRFAIRAAIEAKLFATDRDGGTNG